MAEVRTKSMKKIEEKMAGTNTESMRFQVLQNAKSFKSSWIGLGQALYTVWKDKLYRDWGYIKFEAYTAKEIGIRKQTALKLLKSYYFLEKEGPQYLKNKPGEETDARAVPTYESVDALRLANKKRGIDQADYERLKNDVLTRGKDASEVKKDLTAIIKEREELEPEEARKKKKTALLRRFMSTLMSLSKELRITRVLPAEITKDIDKLIIKIKKYS